MTDRIDLSDLPPAVDTARRDRWGRYLVVPPGGGDPVGYTRVTTVAKSLDDGGGLAPWKAAMAASGIIMRRGLRAQWEALLAQHGDPWYANRASKDEAKRLVEECAAVGGANDRKEVGTALHALTAMVDLGQTPQHLTVETERDLRAYSDGLAQAGIEIIPGAIELCIVLDSVQVAGTFDRLAIVPGFDLPLIADLKTGSNLSFSWNAIAVQLAAYSRGEAVYRQGEAKDGSDDKRQPMPMVDQNYGLVMALDASADTPLELWLVDLQAGWEAFKLSLAARDWRKVTPARSLDDTTPMAPDPNNVVPQMQASIATNEKRKRARKRHPAAGQAQAVQGWGGAVDTADPTASADQAGVDGQGDVQVESIDGYHLDEYRGWLQYRIDGIGEHEVARSALVHTWPEGVPALRASDDHAPGVLVAIERVLDLVEKQYELPFTLTLQQWAEREVERAAGRVIQMFPGTQHATSTGATP